MDPWANRPGSIEAASTVVLDTNVVSKLMRDVPHAGVLVWVDDRPTRQLFVTAVTEAEVRTGVAFLPEGRVRRRLAEAADGAPAFCSPAGSSLRQRGYP